ncbi:ATP-dependent RNA helicase RhlE [compost metagenome]
MPATSRPALKSPPSASVTIPSLLPFLCEPSMTFASLGLIEPLLRALEGLDYKTPTPVQARAIPAVLKGRDLLAAAQTGTGKTAGFALPLLQRLLQEGPQVAANSARALVLVPTRELAEQVHASFRAYGQHVPLRTAVAYGGVSINPQMLKLRKGVDVLVATPGRLLDLYRQNAVKFAQLQTLVLDEADRMLDLGFARELDELFAALPARRQTLLFSATFSDAIRQMAAGLLRDPLTIEVTPRNTAAKTVKQWLVPVDKKRKAELFLHLQQGNRWRQALVFAKTRKGVEELVGLLQQAGLAADSIHGDKPQPARLRALQRFKAGEVDFLVATDVAARGLDIEEMPLVVNFDLPIVAEDYVHRIGRTGRAGATGQALSLVCADEVQLLAAIETLIGQTLQRREEEGFEPEHRVPQTTAGGQVLKKPKKPKQPKVPDAGKAGRIHLGGLLDDKPQVKAVRKAPGFARAAPGKAKKPR